MNIIEAIQQAENGKLINNGIRRKAGHYLKYVGNGIFYEYNIGSALTTQFNPNYIESFSMGDIISIDWEVLDLPKAENGDSSV